jgi:type IV pilus assembly protein PilY1
LMQFRGQDPFYNIAIGSGYRGHPLDKATEERFYAVRDQKPYLKLTQALYNSITPVTNSNLVDATPTTAVVDKTAYGWRLDMKAAGSFVGEKVLSESVTVNNTVLFTSFEPSILGSTKGACYPSTTNRVYAISAYNGQAVLDLNDDGDKDKDGNDVDATDRYSELNQEGIVGDVQVALKDNDGKPQTVCLAGMQVLKKCVDAGRTVRTFWNRADAK